MGNLIQDVKYCLRMLAKNPGFTAVAMLTLALGIGANTAIFSLIDAVILRSIPVRDPSQLMLLQWSARKEPRRNGYSSFGDCGNNLGKSNPSGCSFSVPMFEQIRSEARVFSGLTAFAGPAQIDLSGNGPAAMARGELVTGDYFSTLGVRAIVGRTLGMGDDAPTSAPAIVLSYAYWQTAFGGERSAVGRTIHLNTLPFTIVGVADPTFTNLTPGKTQDFWLPMAMTARLGILWANDLKSPNNWWVVLVARLRPGVSRGTAQAATSLIFRNQLLHGAKPLSKPEEDPVVTLTPIQQGLGGGGRSQMSMVLFIMMAAVGFILLIACANVAGLLLSRAAPRQKEMAVRLALGAGRSRILRQLLTESVLLSVAAGGLGILLAYWGVHAITAMVLKSTGKPFPFVVAPDWRLLMFMLAASLLTGILFGLAPALQSARLDLTPALKENASTSPGGVTRARRWFHLGNALVVTQVAFSALLLVGAGLMVRTLQNLRNVNPGFDTQNVLLFGLNPKLIGEKDNQIQALYRTLQQRLSALPGVISASYSSDALLSGGLWTSTRHVEGQPEKASADLDMLAVGPNFFQTMRIPLLEGRALTDVDFEVAAQADALQKAADASKHSADTATPTTAPAPAPPLIPVLVNAAFAHRYFPGGSPLGKYLSQSEDEETAANAKPNPPRWQIAGVVGDVKYDNLRREIHPTVYVPQTGNGATFELRTASDPTKMVAAVRDVVNQVDNNLPLFRIQTQSESIENLMSMEHIIAQLASFFGILGLLLACVGLYGLLSFEVARRTRELGIRMALGAGRGDVLRLVAGKGFRLSIAGVAVGMAGALGLTRVMSSLLYGVQPTDSSTFLAVSLLLIAVALLASYIPARRATKVDPMVALRYE